MDGRLFMLILARHTNNPRSTLSPSWASSATEMWASQVRSIKGFFITMRPLTVNEMINAEKNMTFMFGVDGVIIIKKIDLLSNTSGAYQVHEGEKWVTGTYDWWRENNFPFWPTISIRRKFSRLEKLGAIISCSFGGMDKTKSYRVKL